MILSIGHQDVALGVDRDALKAFELAFALAPPTEASQEGSVRVENLDSVVAGIRYEDVALLVDGNSSENFAQQFM